MPVMPFADRCSLDFEPQVQSRGQRYFHERRVRLGSTDGETVRAAVAGSSGDYEVLLDWSDARNGIVESSCTCPYFEDQGLCKHIWATMLAADARGLGPRAGSRKLSVLTPDSDEWDLDDEADELEEDEEFFGRRYPSSGSGRRPFSHWQRPRSPSPARWQQQLSAVFNSHPASASGDTALPLVDKAREAWYVLDVTSSLETGVLMIHLFQRETKVSGEFGRLKPMSVDQEDVARFTKPEDREMLRVLLASDEGRSDAYDAHHDRYGYYGYHDYEPKTSQVSLAAGAYEHLLPKLCATGRFVWMLDSSQQVPEEDGRGLAWDDGPPWRFCLCIEADDKKKRWLLEGQLVREGEESPLPLKTPSLLLASGLVLLEDRLARLAVGDFFPWIAALRKASAIAVPYQDRWELLGRLWQLPSQPETSLPPNLRCEEVHVPPQGRLVVHSPERYGSSRLYGDVEFLYDGKGVRAGDRCAGMVDPDKERILVRDRDKEHELLAFLAERGVRPADASGSRDHELWIPHQRLAELVDALVQAGWIVEAEGHLIRKPGQWRLSVTSGIDWFDLEGTCEFDGMAVKLPELLEALRHGQRCVRLGDGSQGLLPQEWLAQFGALANLGEAEGDRIRFRPSQALLLDALLAAQKRVSVDRQFAHIRSKLRSFGGVTQRREPRGFSGQLRDYQKDGLGWLHFLRDFRLGGCLADDMGLGKTVQALALLQSRRTRPTGGVAGRKPSLAVVPRSLVFNWIEEAQRFTPNLRALDYTGPLRKDALEHLDHWDLLVTTYGTLHRDIARLKDIHFDYAILDESQAIKNTQSQRAKACRLLVADHRLAMTGTPVENHLGELWSLFEFLNPGMLGRSSAFQAISKDISAESENVALLRRALAPFILRRTKEQVLTELPRKTEQTLHCDLEGRQRKHYNDLRDYYRAALSKQIEETGLAKAKIHVLEALLRLRQAACHPGLLDKARLDDPSAKLDLLLEQLAEVIAEGHKALVFSQFTSFLAIVRRRLDAEKIVYEYLDGRTRDRKQRVDRFQTDPACPLFLISLKAGGHGLNLTAADYVFILDPWWNPAVEAQAVDRTHRIGQTRHVFAYRLIARDTVEEKVLELQKTKRDLAEAIISADSAVLRNLTAEDLRILLS
jgi:superfamily II DNA or RNA helicase